MLDLSLAALSNLASHPFFQPAILSNLYILGLLEQVAGKMPGTVLSIVYQVLVDQPAAVAKWIEDSKILEGTSIPDE